MDLDPLALVKEEEDHTDTVVKEEPPDECESVALNATEYDLSKCDVSGQFFNPASSSADQGTGQGGLIVPKQERPNIPDECTLEPERLDEIAFVAVKIEPADECSTNQADVVIKKDENKERNRRKRKETYEIAEDSALQYNITDSMPTVASKKSTSVDNTGEPSTTGATGELSTTGATGEPSTTGATGEPSTTGATGEPSTTGATGYPNKRKKSSANFGVIQSHKETVTVSNNQTDVTIKNRITEDSTVQDNIADAVPAIKSQTSTNVATVYQRQNFGVMQSYKETVTVSNNQTDVTIKNRITEDSTVQDDIADAVPAIKSQTSTNVATVYQRQNFGVMQSYKKTVTASPNTCSECGYVAASPSHLKIHASIHASDQPYHCEECPYKCNDSDSLDKHMLLHSGEKPFQCKVCPHRCNTASNLRIHALTHTDNKPFRCDECSFSCRQAGNLKRHKMRHSGEQPYACKECSYTCGQEGSLKRHLWSHRREQPFHCMECAFKTSRLCYLKKHIVDTHSE